MNPKASFVIPVFNGVAYIAEGIRSCQKSSISNIEIVIVDDFSTDSTVDIIERMAKDDPRVVLIRHGANMGRSLARNTGIGAARSDILLMMDHDDIANKSRASIVVDTFKAHPEIDIVYSQFQLIDELGHIGAKVEVMPFDWTRLKKTKFAHIGHSTMAFRKWVFEKVQYTDGDYSKHAIDDWKFQVDAYKAGFKFMPIRKCLAQYRFVQKPRDEAKILELKNACLN